MEINQSQPELPEQSSFQSRDWIVQRASAIFFGLLLLAAAAGIFGGGPLSDATATGGDARVHYQRFQHRECQTTLDLIAPSASSGDAVIEITGDLLTNAEVQSISPAPAAQQPIPGGVSLIFRTIPGSPVHVIIRMIPKDAGMRHASIRLNGVPLAVAVFVYP